MPGMSRLVIFGAFVVLTAIFGAASAWRISATYPVLLSLCAAIFGWTAARTRRPGEPLARLWWLLALAAGLGAAAELGAMFGRRELGWAGMLISNLTWCAALLDLDRRLRRAELVPPLPRAWRLCAGLAIAIATLTAATAVHDALAEPTPDSASAWLWLARGLVGVLCDAVVLAVGVPVLGRLLSLSGGPAAAPFLLILAAAGCFIVADLDSLLAIPAWSARLLIVVGWVALTVAGLTQLALERAEAGRARLLREHLVRVTAAER